MLRWNANDLYWVFGPKLGTIIEWLDSLQKKDRFLGNLAIVGFATFCLAYLFGFCMIADAFGNPVGFGFLVASLLVFRFVLPIKIRKVPDEPM